MKLNEKTVQWCVEQYNAGVTVKDICTAAGITPTTFYRYVAGREDLRRKNSAWGESPEKAALARDTWEKRRGRIGTSIRALKAPGRELTTLEVLSRVNLSLGVDNLGHFLTRDERKIYLTDTEYRKLLKKPLELLKTISSRINTILI
jgi:AcrR family transcriptional regulator